MKCLCKYDETCCQKRIISKREVNSTGLVIKISYTSQALLFKTKNLTPPFAVRIKDLFSEMQLQKPFIKPEISYKILRMTIPTWSIKAPEVDLNLTEHPKNVTPTSVYMAEFRRLRTEKHRDYEEIFTDASRTETGVGSVMIAKGCKQVTTALKKIATIFSA